MWRSIDKDGETVWVAAQGEVEAWEDGKVASLRGTRLHEITERKRHEEQLAAEREPVPLAGACQLADRVD